MDDSSYEFAKKGLALQRPESYKQFLLSDIFSNFQWDQGFLCVCTWSIRLTACQLKKLQNMSKSHEK